MGERLENIYELRAQSINLLSNEEPIDSIQVS